MEVVQKIFKNDGIAGFWKGLVPMLAGVVPARAVYFYTYNGSKNFLKVRGHSDTAPTHLMAAVVAGATTCTMISPVWVIKTRLQLQYSGVALEAGQKQYSGSIHAIRMIYREEGMRGFFKGLVPSYWGISESALHFMLYEALKKRIAQRRGDAVVASHSGQARATKEEEEEGGRSTKQMEHWEYMAAAGSAKLVASSATYPHEVIRTRMRERGASARYTSSIHCVQRVWLEEGMRGLYAGMGTHLVRVVPNTIIIFLAYEKVSAMLA